MVKYLEFQAFTILFIKYVYYFHPKRTAQNVLNPSSALAGLPYLGVSVICEL